MVILELNNNNQKQTPLRYCTITSGKTILKVSRTFMLILLAELQVSLHVSLHTQTQFFQVFIPLCAHAAVTSTELHFTHLTAFRENHSKEESILCQTLTSIQCSLNSQNTRFHSIPVSSYIKGYLDHNRPQSKFPMLSLDHFHAQSCTHLSVLLNQHHCILTELGRSI